MFSESLPSRLSDGREPRLPALYKAIAEGGRACGVRPKMMTVVAIMAVVLPIMGSTGAGTGTDPMAGGMISSTVLTLGVIPTIWT